MTIARSESVPDTVLFGFQQGNFDVTVLSDGHFVLPGGIVAPEASSDEWLDIERRLGGSIRAHANIPLIRSGDDLILIDLGGGGRFQPTEGRLASSLAAAGHDGEAITKVLLTYGQLAGREKLIWYSREDAPCC